MGNLRDIVNIARDVSQIVSDLASVQLRQLTELYRVMLTKLFAWLATVLTAILLAIGGLGLVLWGVHLVLSLAIGPAASAFILGGFLLMCAVIVYLVGRGMLKS